MLRLLASLMVLLTLALPAGAAKRVALVIGNAEYTHVGVLDAPPRDVRLLVDTLNKLKFDDVKLLENLDAQALRRALQEFSDMAATADVALIYFAGHGIEVNKRNYLVPVDARLKKAKDADFEAVELEHFRAAVDGARQLRMVVLDACRNNPFPLEAKDGTRSLRSRGLAEVQPGVNELIAFSAQAGVVADDRAADGYSPFASSFSKWIAEPGLDIRFVMGHVRDDVLKSTGTTDEREGPQIPYVELSLGGEQIVLGDEAPAIVAEPVVPPEPAPAADAPAPVAKSSFAVNEDETWHPATLVFQDDPQFFKKVSNQIKTCWQNQKQKIGNYYLCKGTFGSFTNQWAVLVDVESKNAYRIPDAIHSISVSGRCLKYDNINSLEESSVEENGSIEYYLFERGMFRMRLANGSDRMPKRCNI